MSCSHESEQCKVALTAVQADGRALQFAGEKLRKDRGVVLAAVRNDGYALRFADKAVTRDHEVAYLYSIYVCMYLLVSLFSFAASA